MSSDADVLSPVAGRAEDYEALVHQLETVQVQLEKASDMVSAMEDILLFVLALAAIRLAGTVVRLACRVARVGLPRWLDLLL